jgi:hypothetical protein
LTLRDASDADDAIRTKAAAPLMASAMTVP